VHSSVTVRFRVRVIWLNFIASSRARVGVRNKARIKVQIMVGSRFRSGLILGLEL
jgi:hypothetical protein